MNNRICSILIFLFGFLFIVPEKLYAQSPLPNARDDSYPLLGLKRAKSSYDRAESELSRKKELFSKNLISPAKQHQIHSKMS